MENIINGFYEGERPLFRGKDLFIKDTVFSVGESPLKESESITLENSVFEWKYPLWYAKDVTAKNCVWKQMARAGVWYSQNVSVCDCRIDAPKNFRRSKDIRVENVVFSDAAETFWQCDGVRIKNVTAKGDYLMMNCSDVVVDGLDLNGNYCFDGAKNVRVENSRLMSKDAFWNCENVTVVNSVISGEYIGWNSKNLALIDCTVQSLQGFCYIENLKIENCKLAGTSLAFEYSTVEADVTGSIDSVFNPTAGMISADSIGELIMDENSKARTKIIIKR